MGGLVVGRRKAFGDTAGARDWEEAGLRVDDLRDVIAAAASRCGGPLREG